MHPDKIDNGTNALEQKKRRKKEKKKKEERERKKKELWKSDHPVKPLCVR